MSAIKEWFTLIALVISVLSQVITWVSTGRDLITKVDRLTESYGEVKVKLESIEKRGLDSANELTQLRTEVRALGKATDELRQEVSERPKKRK